MSGWHARVFIATLPILRYLRLQNRKKERKKEQVVPLARPFAERKGKGRAMSERGQRGEEGEDVP